MTVHAYKIIKEDIKDKIIKRIYIPGSRLPTEAFLMRNYNNSRGTIRKAVTELVNEGVLKKNSMGTFISYPKIEKGLTKLTGFSEDIISRGGSPSSTIISKQIIDPPSEIAEKLNLAEKEKIIEIRRIRSDSGIPIAWEIVRLPYKFCPDILEEDLTKMSLYKILEDKYELDIANAVMSVSPSYVTKQDILYVDVDPQDLMLSSERITYLSNQIPIEVTTTRYRVDVYEFMVTLNR